MAKATVMKHFQAENGRSDHSASEKGEDVDAADGAADEGKVRAEEEASGEERRGQGEEEASDEADVETEKGSLFGDGQALEEGLEYGGSGKATRAAKPSKAGRSTESQRRINESKDGLHTAWTAVLDLIKPAALAEGDPFPAPEDTATQSLEVLMVEIPGIIAKGPADSVGIEKLVPVLQQLEFRQGQVMHELEASEKARKEKATSSGRTIRARQEARFNVAKSSVIDAIEPFENMVDVDLKARAPKKGAVAQAKRTIRYQLAQLIIDDLDGDTQSRLAEAIEHETHALLARWPRGAKGRPKKNSSTTTAPRIEAQRLENAEVSAQAQAIVGYVKDAPVLTVATKADLAKATHIKVMRSGKTKQKQPLKLIHPAHIFSGLGAVDDTSVTAGIKKVTSETHEVWEAKRAAKSAAMAYKNESKDAEASADGIPDLTQKKGKQEKKIKPSQASLAKQSPPVPRVTLRNAGQKRKRGGAAPYATSRAGGNPLWRGGV